MKLKLAYIAGYIDGDGCFYVQKQTNPIKYRSMLIISSTNKKTIYYFFKIFNGFVRCAIPKKKNHKLQYHWGIRGKNAFQLLCKFQKHLVIKKNDSCVFKNFIKAKTKCQKEVYIKKMNNSRNEIIQINEEVIKEIKTIKCTGLRKEEECAYLAGFIDAECHFGISKYKPKNRPNFTYKIVLQCQNTNALIFFWLMKKLGGSISHVKRNHKNPKHRDQIIWNLSGKSLSKILPKVYPFLLNKKEVCKKVMEFYETTLPNGGQRKSEEFKKSYQEILVIRESIVNQIHKLNSKGIISV